MKRYLNILFVLLLSVFTLSSLAMAGDTVIVAADHVVPVGVIAPDHVVTPAAIVDYLVANR